jgi:hypothetical protein
MNQIVPAKLSYSFESPCGYYTIDGEFICGEVGQYALLTGAAVLVGGLLVGDLGAAFAALPTMLRLPSF